VRVTKREKRACKDCEEQGVQCAPLPPRHRRTTLARLHRLFGMQENLAYHHATGVRVCHFPQELRSAIVGTAPLCGASLRALLAGLRPQD
jgi:hypothetical protein